MTKLEKAFYTLFTGLVGYTPDEYDHAAENIKNILKTIEKHIVFYENGGIAFKKISNKKNIKEYELLKDYFSKE